MQTERQALGVTDQRCLDHTVKWTSKSSEIRLRDTIVQTDYILEVSSHYCSTMFYCILVSVGKIEKVRENTSESPLRPRSPSTGIC